LKIKIIIKQMNYLIDLIVII